MNPLPLRVTVLDTWDEVRLEVAPTTLVREVKREALRGAGVRAEPDRYVVKYLGAELPEDGATLADVGVPANAALIVMSRRRRPVT